MSKRFFRQCVGLFGLVLLITFIASEQLEVGGFFFDLLKTLLHRDGGDIGLHIGKKDLLPGSVPG